jgi:hypothetical protein
MRGILIVAIVGAVALAACGGSSNNSKAKTNAGSNPSSVSASFDQLYNQRSDATLKVTYQALDNSGAAGSTFTIAQEGKDKTAYVNGDTEVIVNGDTVTQCSNMQDTPQCTSTSGGAAAAQAMVAGYTALFSAAQTGIGAWAAAHGAGNQTTETIAGRTAQCVTITATSGLGALSGAAAKALAGKAADAGYEACIDKDTGVLLKWVVTGVAGDNSGIAASAVTQPTDADFQPPANAKTSTQTTEPNSAGAGATGGGGNGGSSPTTCMQLPSGVPMPQGVNVPGYC